VLVLVTGNTLYRRGWTRRIIGINVFEAEAQLDVGPLRRFLKDGVRLWNIAGISTTNRDAELEPDNIHRHLSHSNGLSKVQ
jgi:hypothetical protein